MTRHEFLAALEQCLSSLPAEERRDALRYYEDYLDAAGPENEARAIAELGTPEEVARTILDEQAPGMAAAPAQPAPARKPHVWRMWLGVGLALLALGCFFFQRSGATPATPETPASSTSVPAASASGSTSAGETPVVLTADDLGSSTYNIPLDKLSSELSLELNYGSVAMVIDPSAACATLQFDNFPHVPVLRTTGTGGRTTFRYELPENYQIVEGAPEALLTITLPDTASLERLVLDLEQGSADLGTLQLERLTVNLGNGSLSAEDLTVEEIEAELSSGKFDVLALSGVQSAYINAHAAIFLDLADGPEAYTIHARSGNVVQVIDTKYPEQYDVEGSARTLTLSADGMIALNAPRHP